MRYSSKRPDVFNHPSKHINNVTNAVENEVINQFRYAIDNSGEDVNVKQMPRYLEVTEKQKNKNGYVDLKQSFARSPKRKMKKNGGWYLIVPMRLKTSKMSRSMYYQVNKIPTNRKFNNANLADILQNSNGYKNDIPITQGSKNNITRVKPKGKRNSTYVMFRTVSDKSPAGSWFSNGRDKKSKTFSENLRRLVQWQAKNLGK